MAKESILNFLKKLRAMDEVPEEIVDAACDMADEAAEEEKEETVDEEVVEEKDEAPDFSKMIKDAVDKALRDAGVIKDEAMEKLDSLDEELVSNDVDGEEEVTVDPEKIKNTDSIRNVIKMVKPEIAKVKDANVRKSIADSIAALAKIQKNTTTDYASILSAVNNNKKQNAENIAAKDAMMDDFNVGNSIAKKFNPHYKEVK